MIVDAGRQRIPLRSRDAIDVAALVRRLDLVLLLAVATLVGYGLWAVSGITRFDVPGDSDYFVVRQAIAAAIGGVGLVIAILTPPSVYRRHWRTVYVGTIALMVFVFAFAEAIRGSKRWIELGPIQFQPSEFGKVLFVLAIAGFLVERQRMIGRLRTVASAIALAVVPLLLVFLQPDLGTALVYAAALSAVLFLAGVRWLHLVLLVGLAATLVASVLWFLPASGIEVLKPYQTARLTGFTNPDSDPSGLTYNVNQSITAVGAGGLEGRGVTEASQTRFDYLPEHATDFVFASFAEQRGFFGAGDPPAALPARRVARATGRDGRRRPVRRRRRGGDRVRVPLPGVRQCRHDDGHRTGDGDSVAVRDRRRLVDGREPRRHRDPAGDPRPRPGGRRPASVSVYGIGPRHVLALARDARESAVPTRPLLVTGVLAAQLARELAAGGDPALVRTRGEPSTAAALVRVVAGAATREDEDQLRAATRALVPVVVVQTGISSVRLPYVLATDIVECRPGTGFPVEEIAGVLARVLGPAGPALAAGLPVLRDAVERRRIGAAAVRGRRAHGADPQRRTAAAGARARTSANVDRPLDGPGCAAGPRGSPGLRSGRRASPRRGGRRRAAHTHARAPAARSEPLPRGRRRGVRHARARSARPCSRAPNNMTPCAAGTRCAGRCFVVSRPDM